MPKKHIEKGITKSKGVLTPVDIGIIANLIHDTFDTRLAPIENKLSFVEQNMATKDDLRATEERMESHLKQTVIELKIYIHEGIETIMNELDRVEDMPIR